MLVLEKERVEINPGRYTMLSDKQVKKFQKIYKEVVGEEISATEAVMQGSQLVRLMEIIYKPITREQLDRLEKVRLDEAQGHKKA